MGATATEKAHQKTGILKQVIFALILAAAKMEIGLITGWSTVLPKMEADNTTRLDVSKTDVKWLVSMPSFTGIAVSPFIGPLMELMGPRKFLLVFLLPAGFAVLLQAFTPYISLLYLGRMITSISATASDPVFSVLTAELCEPGIRGLLISVGEITIAVGLMLMYIMTHFLPWNIATAVCAAPVLLFAFLTFFVPESPYWLVRRGQKEAALKSLVKLRDPAHDVDLELLQITNSAQEQPQSTFKEQLKQLAMPQNYRPVLLLMSVFALREIGGRYIIFSYTVYLFRNAGVLLDAFTCTVLVGVVNLVFNIVSTIIIDRVGRRPLLIATSLAGGLALALGAIFVLVKLPGSSWVPLAAILFYVFCHGLGISPIPWTLLGELIPTPVRFIGTSICSLNYTVSQFVMSFVFQYLLELGVGEMLLVFASVHVLLTLLVFFFLPETRCRSLSDLQEEFNANAGNSKTSLQC